MRTIEIATSPLGPLLLVEFREHLEGLHFLDEEPAAALDAATVATLCGITTERERERRSRDGVSVAPVLGGAAARQLADYFDGRLREFDLPLAPVGTPYQENVWRALSRVPFGETWTYGDLAREVGDTHPRPVGGAVARNPIAIILPCHRVIASATRLGGYSGGLERKVALLQHEGAAVLLEEGSPSFASRIAKGDS